MQFIPLSSRFFPQLRAHATLMNNVRKFMIMAGVIGFIGEWRQKKFFVVLTLVGFELMFLLLAVM
jgi:hypothetical protein